MKHCADNLEGLSMSIHSDIKVYDSETRKRTEFTIFLVYAITACLTCCHTIYKYAHLKYHLTEYVEGSSLVSGQTAIMSLYSLISGFTCLIIAVALVIASHIAFHEIHRRRGFLYLGIMLIAVSQWIISGNPLGKMFYGNGELAKSVTFVAMISIALPLLMYIDYLEFNTFSRFFDSYCIALLVFNTVLTVFYYGLHGSGSFFFAAAFAEHIASFAIIFLSFSLLYRKGGKTAPGHLAIIIGTAVLAGTTIYEIVSAANISEASSKVVLATGINVFIICAMISVVNFFSRKQTETSQQSARTEAKNRFVNNIANQVRLPLQTTESLLDLIYEHSENEDRSELSLEAKNTSKNLLAAIENLLDYAQTGGEFMELAPDKYYSADLLSDIISLADILSYRGDTRIDVTADVTIPRTLYGDRKHLCQLIINLIFTSLDHSAAKNLSVEIAFVTESELGLCFAVQLTDDGEAQTPAELAAARKVISAGNRLLEAENRNQTIGLAIAAGLANQISGKIELSVNGKGENVIVLAVPQEVIDGHPVGSVKEAIRERRNIAAAKGAPESTVRADAAILLVDGNAVNRRILIRLLNSFGIDPMIVSDGEAALRLCSKRTFDLIFLDEDLAGISGQGCLAAMRENSPAYNDIPSVLLSSTLVPADAEEVHAMGFTEVLSRPYSRELLHGILLKYLPLA